MKDDTNRLETLLAWHEELWGQVERLREQQAELSDEISTKEAQLRNIDQLLESEGCPATGRREAHSGKAGSLADRAFAVLNESGKPWYYRELAERLREIGVHIPGNDRAANLLAHIGRDERFQRVKRGTYALSEWRAKVVDRRRAGKSEESGSTEGSDTSESGQRR